MGGLHASWRQQSYDDCKRFLKRYRQYPQDICSLQGLQRLTTFLIHDTWRHLTHQERKFTLSVLRRLCAWVAQDEECYYLRLALAKVAEHQALDTYCKGCLDTLSAFSYQPVRPDWLTTGVMGVELQKGEVTVNRLQRFIILTGFDLSEVASAEMAQRFLLARLHYGLARDLRRSPNSESPWYQELLLERTERMLRDVLAHPSSSVDSVEDRILIEFKGVEKKLTVDPSDFSEELFALSLTRQNKVLST